MPIILKLRENKHFIFSIAEKFPGIDDDEVLKIAFNSKSILLTQDKLCLNVVTDFGEKIPGSFTVLYKDFVKIRLS